MIPLTHMSGQTIGVFGLGQTGLPTVQALLEGGARVIAWDDNEAARTGLDPDFLIPVEDWPWAEMSRMVLSPGVPFTHPEPHAVVLAAGEANVPVIGDVELFWREVRSTPNVRFVGITGTNGKSTTTALLHHCLKEAGYNVQMGGNIGRGVFDLDPPGENTIYVLELSSYQLDLIVDFEPDIAILLNLSPDHIDRHGDFAGYVAAKMRLFASMDETSICIVGQDDEPSQDCTKRLIAQGLTVTPISGQEVQPKGISATAGLLAEKGRAVADLSSIATLQGQHNWQNAAAVYAALRALGLSQGQATKGFASFPGLPHRMEPVAVIGGVHYINDSKATNADATAPALKTFDRIRWIAGGREKEGGIEGLAPHFGKIIKAYLIGEAAENFAATLEPYVPVEISGTLPRAFIAASEEARPGETVLLAPACSSFDQFESFERRGNAFRALTVSLADRSGEAA